MHVGVVFAVGGDGGLAGEHAAVIGRGARRRHMVEEAVVLVEVDQEHGLAPDVRIGRQRIEHFLRVPGTLHRAGRPRVLGVGGRRHDPRDLRQAARRDVILQRLQEAAVRHGVADALDERVDDVVGDGIGRIGAAVGRIASRLVGLAVLHEAGQRIIGEVVRHVLVQLPAHAGRLQAFRIGGPAVAAGGGAHGVAAVVDHGAAVGAGGVVGAGPVEQAVGVGAAMEAAVVGVA